jgi:hypothetical protein
VCNGVLRVRDPVGAGDVFHVDVVRARFRHFEVPGEGVGSDSGRVVVVLEVEVIQLLTTFTWLRRPGRCSPPS